MKHSGTMFYSQMQQYSDNFKGIVTSMALYGGHMITGAQDGMINIWRNRDWECLTTLKGHR